MVSDEIGDAFASCSCTSCRSSATSTPSRAAIGGWEGWVSSLALWSSFSSGLVSVSCTAGISPVSVLSSRVGEGGKAIEAGVVGLVFEASEVSAETCRLEGFLDNVLEVDTATR